MPELIYASCASTVAFGADWPLIVRFVPTPTNRLGLLVVHGGDEHRSWARCFSNENLEKYVDRVSFDVPFQVLRQNLHLVQIRNY